jgi:hypothetical protein
MIQKYKNIIIVVVLIIGGFYAYNTFTAPESEPSASLQVTSSADVLGSDIIKAINQINDLKLDRSVFDDPIFRTLVDRSEEILPQAKSRPNPFAPIADSDFGVNNDGTQLNFDSGDTGDDDITEENTDSEPEGSENEIPSEL